MYKITPLRKKVQIKKYASFFVSLILLFPGLSFAASTPTTYSGFVGLILDIINIIIPTLFGFLFVFFIWKMIDSWVIHADDPQSRENGRKYAISAVFVFVLMVSAWGIVEMIKTSFFG